MKYNIVIQTVNQEVIVYPSFRGLPAHSKPLGEYTPVNPRADLDEYKESLLDKVRSLLGSHATMKVVIRPLDGSGVVNTSA